MSPIFLDHNKYPEYMKLFLLGIKSIEKKSMNSFYFLWIITNKVVSKNSRKIKYLWIMWTRNNINNVIYCNLNDTNKKLCFNKHKIMFWRKFIKKIARNVFSSELCDDLGSGCLWHENIEDLKLLKIIENLKNVFSKKNSRKFQ